VKTETGEEGEDALWQNRAKLFRFDKASNQWKERGTGTAKLLQHKESKKIRFLMRREGTLKICANHMVMPEMELKPSHGSDRAWVWQTPCDVSDDEGQPEIFAIRFPTAENATKFKESFEAAQKQMQQASSQ